MVRHRPRAAFDLVYGLAARQYGIVTPADAVAHTVPAETLRTLTHRGMLRHVTHGVYRLSNTPMEGRTKLMALCRWPHASRWALTGAAALWVVAEAGRDERTWEWMCPAVTLLVSRHYRTHRDPPASLQLVRSLDDDTPLQVHAPFWIDPMADALLRAAEELAADAASALYQYDGRREVAHTQLMTWARRLITRGVVDSTALDAAADHFGVTYDRMKSHWRRR